MHKSSIRKPGIYIVKVGSSDRESSLIQNKFSSKNVANVPKSASREIDNIISEEKTGEIYGSSAQYTHSYSVRKPQDIDMASERPEETASRIQSALRRRGIRSKIVALRTPNRFIKVEIKKKGKWVETAGIHEIKGHYDKYDVYGSAMQPERVGKFNVQSVKDQMYRKANSVLAEGGAPEYRRVKDESDFVAITRLRLDEKQLQAEAELKRVKKARKQLEKIKEHVRHEKGWSKKKYPLNKDPIPEKQEQKFISYAIKHPEKDVRNITLRNNSVTSSQKKVKNNTKNMFDFSNLNLSSEVVMKPYKEPKVSKCPFRLGGNSKKTTYVNFLTQKKYKLNSKRIF